MKVMKKILPALLLFAAISSFGIRTSSKGGRSPYRCAGTRSFTQQRRERVRFCGGCDAGRQVFLRSH